MASSRVIISCGVEMFSRPSFAACRSIILRRRRVWVRPSESSMAFTFCMPTRSMSTLVAELSLTATIIVARSRRVKRVTPDVSPPMMSAVGNQIGRLHRVQIGELELALLHLQIQIGQDRDLDRTGLGEDLVLVQEEVVAGGEVLDRHSHDSVEVLVDLLNAGLKLLPENFLFAGRGRGSLGKARSKE